MSLVYVHIQPCADVILSAVVRRVILTGGSGASIDFFFSGGGVWRCGSQE